MLAAARNWELPPFHEQSFHPRTTRYCVCVFVLNEGERIARQLRRMQRHAADVDIIIADGGSTDGSLAPAFLSSVGVRALLVKQGPGKLSAQMRMAFAFGLREGYEGILTIDGNDKDDPEAIPRFVEALDQGFDHVQGSRFISGGRAVNTPLARWLGVRLIHAPMISLAAGFCYTDTTNGFRAYSRGFLTDPLVNPFRNVFDTYELHYYLAIRAARLGYRVTEVPVTRSYPAQGPAPTKISPIRGNLFVLKILFQACAGRFNPEAGGNSSSRDHSDG